MTSNDMTFILSENGGDNIRVSGRWTAGLCGQQQNVHLLLVNCVVAESGSESHLFFYCRSQDSVQL